MNALICREKKGALRCKIVNSKSDLAVNNPTGSGISNVKKRLDFIYPQKHDLRINDEGDFFVATLQVQLYADAPAYAAPDDGLVMVLQPVSA